MPLPQVVLISGADNKDCARLITTAMNALCFRWFGSQRLKFLATPQVLHGWDAGLFFESVSCSHLYFHPGDPEPLTESDVVGLASVSITEGLSGPLANDTPFTPYTDTTLRRLAEANNL